MEIKCNYSFPGHPQVNGQVEAINKILLDIPKKKLLAREEEKLGREELVVLSTNMKIAKMLTRRTPFTWYMEAKQSRQSKSSYPIIK